jgi:hypothetical protein
MKKIVTIFLLPNEIDLYRDLISRISKDLTKYNLQDFWIDSTLCVSDQMVNWEQSQVSKEQVILWFEEINQNLQGDFSVDQDGAIQGCVDKRRESVQKYSNALSFTWIDPDILFPEGTFYIISESVQVLGNSNFIITPQYVKMWDSSWDVLVHASYQNFPYDYMKTADYDPNKEFGIYGDVALKSLPKGLFKFGGGAITTFSGEVLRKFPIPTSFGSYGEEDTFVMICCSYLAEKFNISQYVIENLVYTQKNRDSIDRRKDIKVYDRRAENRQISLNNFSTELKNTLTSYKK